MTEVTEAAAAAEPAPPSADSTTPSAHPTSRPRPAGPHIELCGVHVSHPGAPNEALAGIDLQIPAGQYVCILGGNGSGKSTLLQLMNALALPSAGEVRVFGVNTSEEGAPLAIRSRCASVFQHPEDQMVTSIVADDVAFGPENLCVPQPEIARRVDAALEATGMGEFAQSDPADLSGGQMQRVAIAGALAMEPEILLLDEPCAMLDTRGRADVRAIIDRLSARGITIVHVTHFMEDALDADRVIVLERGRIAFDGLPEQAFSNEDRVRALGLEAPCEPRRILDAMKARSAASSAVSPAVPSAVPSAVSPASSPASSRAASSAAVDPDLAFPGEPSVVFDGVSFSYAAARNPRKRRGGFLGGGKRIEDAPPTAPLAVSDLSFRAFPGTLTALVGRTGSGKSTTAELACALKLPLSGTVRICGVDTADLNRRSDIRRHVGYVSQLPERQLFAETVFEDVAFGPRNLGLSDDEVSTRVRDALASVNLDPTDELLARSPFSLSGGQQRGVALAGVLAMRQDVLVLDEPMAGLDPAGRRHVRAILHDLKRAGSTLIMVTHSMEDVAELADQVIALDRGRTVASGTPEQVLPALLDAEEVRGHGPSR